MSKVTYSLASSMARMSIVAATLLVIVPLVPAQDGVTDSPELDDAAISARLDETRDAIFALFNEEKYSEIAEQYCHEDITCLWNDGTTSKGRQGVTDFFAKLKTFIDVLHVAPTTQDRAVHEGGKYAVSIGNMGDTYVMADGKEFDLQSVWMATLVYDNEEWKLISYAVSTNAFDNQVIDGYLFLRTLVAGGVGIAIGLVLALALTKLRKKQSS